MRHFVFALSMSLLVACGKDATNDGPPDAAAITGDKYSLQWGPVTVQPGEENTQCVTLRLGNAAAIKVHQIHNVLGPGSHHVIVYRDNMNTTEVPTPVNCQPFTGALNPTGMVAPMMITQKKDDLLTLPDGVAYTLAANQMIRIEMHFINSTDAAITTMATSDLYAAPDATIHDEANILFIGTVDIDLPAGMTTTVNEFFQPGGTYAPVDLSSAKFFAITGHTHRLGTDMEVSYAPSSTGTKTSVYAPVPFLWSEPETTTHKPEFTLPPGGGFDFKCTYNNTSGAQVKFGESANNEMCFFWAYYYPSNGSHVCIHTNQVGGASGIDLCCPDAGQTLCSMVK